MSIANGVPSSPIAGVSNCVPAQSGVSAPLSTRTTACQASGVIERRNDASHERLEVDIFLCKPLPEDHDYRLSPLATEAKSLDRCQHIDVLRQNEPFVWPRRPVNHANCVFGVGTESLGWRGCCRPLVDDCVEML